MNLKQIKKKVSKKSKIKYTLIDIVIRNFINEVRENTLNGEDVLITGLGTFKLHYVEKPTFYDIHKAETVTLPPRFVLKFIISKSFQESAKQKKVSYN